MVSKFDATIQHSQEKFNLLKEKMREPIKQVQQARQESLKSLLKEIENKQHLLQEKRKLDEAITQTINARLFYEKYKSLLDKAKQIHQQKYVPL
ncbi:4996_t:CDS:2 [Ambispora leptoticha]|uniref:4996_t:CDS:1 n=1 Tax=Ambispora leptoticha TaxID=144679 RepID=A0A9N9ILM5_9GLOM|nr:4996_t:CDS:2 [Ambispora leptoticha]